MDWNVLYVLQHQRACMTALQSMPSPFSCPASLLTASVLSCLLRYLLVSGRVGKQKKHTAPSTVLGTPSSRNKIRHRSMDGLPSDETENAARPPNAPARAPQEMKRPIRFEISVFLYHCALTHMSYAKKAGEGKKITILKYRAMACPNMASIAHQPLTFLIIR